MPVWWRQPGVTRFHRSPGLHSSPWTTSLDTIFALYDAASSSTSGTTQRRRVRRVLHSFVEFILLYTTAKREVSSKGNGRRPGEGWRSDGREEHNRVTKRPWQEEGDLFRDLLRDLLVDLTRRGGPFWGPFGGPYPKGGPPQGGPSQSGQGGGPPQGG